MLHITIRRVASIASDDNPTKPAYIPVTAVLIVGKFGDT